jgi:nucleotide-binding universal stress UspA family protein
MKNLRTILVPVDFSPGSVAAAEHARELAAIFDSHVHLLHVVPAPDVPVCAVEPHWGKLRTLHQPTRVRALDRLATMIARVEFDPFTTTGLVRTGRADCVISEYAAEIGAGLIVMGTHGDHAQPVGDVLERVIGEVVCPVLAIPARVAAIERHNLLEREPECVAC